MLKTNTMTFGIGLLVVVVIALILLPEPKVLAKPSFVLTNIHLYDGEQWHDNATITVVEGEVVQGDVEYAELPRIDGEGNYLVPGLIDAHTHSWGTALEQSLVFGVTSVLDMFTDINFMRTNHQSRPQSVMQARLFSSGTLVTSEGGHGTQFGLPIPTIETPEDAETFVKARLREGSDYIKIVYDAEPDKPQFGMAFTSIDQAVLNAVVEATHKHKKLAVVHAMDETSAKHAIEAGADGLVHSIGKSIMSDELLELIARTNVFVIPTNSILASIGKQQRGVALLEHSSLAEKLDSKGKAGLISSFAPSVGSEQFWLNALENTRLMQASGITVLSGTDAPNAGTTHGISLHDELAIMVEAGMTPTQALHSATGAVSDNFKLTKVGKLLPGYHADMIMLSEDPRVDIKHTQTITRVWLSGIDINTPDLD